MEAIGENLIPVNVGLNFQVKVIDISCPEIVSYLTGLESGDTVQIYPHTVNPYTISSEPNAVAGRKVKGGSAFGPVIILPVRNLDLNEEQKRTLKHFNCEEDKISHTTRIKGSACSGLLESLTGLQVGSKVQYYPYTIEVCIEENGSSVSLSPVTIAVRKVNKDKEAYGDFSWISISDLCLKQGQMDEVKDIILGSLSDLLKKSNFNEKDVKYLIKKFSKKLNFSEEGLRSYLEEDILELEEGGY